MPMEFWTARLDRPLTETERLAMCSLLPPERRERLLRMRDAERQREPLCAYFLLCMALWKREGWRKLPEIARASSGKPYFPEYPGIHFNLSHTKGAVLAGVADEPLGVDIERIRPVGRRMMQRLVQAETEEAFFQSWVRWEARSKRSGKGIGSMKEEPLQEGEFYYPLDTFPGYAAGVSTRSPETPGALHRYSLDDMQNAL